MASLNILDAMGGLTYPEKVVTVFTDLKALSELGALESEIAALTNSKEDVKRGKELDAIQEDLRSQVMKSRWEFTLRGLPRSVIEAMSKKLTATVKDQQDRIREMNEAAVTRSVVKIVNADGKDADFTDDQLVEFFRAIPDDVWLKFVEAAGDVSNDTLKYEYKVTDPNFSQRN